MSEINLVDTSLKKSREDKELSMQVSQHGLTYCINSRVSKSIMAFRTYKFSEVILLDDLLKQTEHILQRDPLLKLPFTKSRCLYVSRKSTIIPDEFFEPELLKKYIEFNQPIDDLDELHFHNIFRIKSKLVFAVPTYLAAQITKKFKNVEFSNQSGPLINLLGGVSIKTDNFQVIINLNKEFFDIIVYRQGKLTLCNNYLYTNSNDLLYFVLFVCKQLNIDLSTATFYILGEFSQNHHLVHELSVYIKNLKKLDPGHGLSFKVKVKNEIQQKYASLLKLI